MTSKNIENLEVIYELDNFDRHRPFWQFGFADGICLTLSIILKMDEDSFFEAAISLMEYPFYFFLLCFYDSISEYEQHNFGEKEVKLSHDEIIERINILETFLSHETITEQVFCTYFLNLNFKTHEIQRYIQYVDQYKELFTIMVKQLKEWLNIYMLHPKFFKFIICGY